MEKQLQEQIPSIPFVSQVKDAADKSFGKSILNVSNAGTGPMYPFVEILKSSLHCNWKHIHVFKNSFSK